MPSIATVGNCFFIPFNSDGTVGQKIHSLEPNHPVVKKAFDLVALKVCAEFMEKAFLVMLPVSAVIMTAVVFQFLKPAVLVVSLTVTALAAGILFLCKFAEPIVKDELLSLQSTLPQNTNPVQPTDRSDTGSVGSV